MPRARRVAHRSGSSRSRAASRAMPEASPTRTRVTASAGSSAKDGMSVRTTGTPAASASSGGSGKPSASNDACRRTSRPWYHAGIAAAGSAWEYASGAHRVRSASVSGSALARCRRMSRPPSRSLRAARRATPIPFRGASNGPTTPRTGGREVPRGNHLRQDVEWPRIPPFEKREKVRGDEELRDVLPIGLFDLLEPVKGVWMGRLVALTEMEDARRAARVDDGDDRREPRGDVDVGLGKRGRVERRDLVDSHRNVEPIVPAVPRDENDVVPARLQPRGVLDDDLDAARQLEGLEDVRDPHPGPSPRAGIDVQVAGRLMKPLRQVSDSTWNVRSLRASKSARDFSSAR